MSGGREVGETPDSLPDLPDHPIPLKTVQWPLLLPKTSPITTWNTKLHLITIRIKLLTF